MLAWLIGFALFSVAELALWYGAANGWTSAAFRIYYLAGGILVVPYLAVGELLLIAPGRRFTRLAVATMLWVTFASTAAVIAADVDAAQAGERRRDPAERRDGRSVDDDPRRRAELGRHRRSCSAGRCRPPAAAATRGRCWSPRA